ncbi:MAG: DUF192 domain-containing protein [Flammeovirgaceae bacterium]
MSTRNRIIIGLLLVVFLGGYFVVPFFKSTGNTKRNASVEPKFRKDGVLTFTNPDDSTFANPTIDIEVADEHWERRRGLMDRTSMAPNQGMLFLFEKAEPQGFWMHRTHISLDIIYVGADKKVVSIQKYAVPFSEETLPSAKPAQYVVEVNAGFCDQYGIKEGHSIDWQLGI